MSWQSTPELLVLHCMRLQGSADAAAVRHRFGVDLDLAAELLLDFESIGLVRRFSYAGAHGCTLTDSGRAEVQRMLAHELDEAGARTTVEMAYEDFVRLNPRFLKAITNWQIRPTRGEPLAANDHSDWRWDEAVLTSLLLLGRELGPLANRLASTLARFGGYSDRFRVSLERASQGQRKWLDEPGLDSAHAVWFQLHEDLLATLGRDRTAETGG